MLISSDLNSRFINAIIESGSISLTRSHVRFTAFADNLSKAGWSLGWVSAIDCEGRAIWIVDAHRDDGKRFVVRADEKLTAFWNLNRRSRPKRQSLHVTARAFDSKSVAIEGVLLGVCNAKSPNMLLITALMIPWVSANEQL